MKDINIWDAKRRAMMDAARRERAVTGRVVIASWAVSAFLLIGALFVLIFG